jgi:hypothetical protein
VGLGRLFFLLVKEVPCLRQNEHGRSNLDDVLGAAAQEDHRLDQLDDPVIHFQRLGRHPDQRRLDQPGRVVGLAHVTGEVLGLGAQGLACLGGCLLLLGQRLHAARPAIGRRHRLGLLIPHLGHPSRPLGRAGRGLDRRRLGLAQSLS